jgi:hypothetical protein
MSCTGQTITFIPFASVAERTVFRPGTAATDASAAGAGAPTAAAASERKLLKNEAKRFFMEIQAKASRTVTMGARTAQCKGG